MIRSKLLITFLTFFGFSFVANNAVIGYGCADSALPAKNQELFYMGFELGLSSTLGHDRATKLLTKEVIADHSQSGAVRSVKLLIEKKVSMIVGFPTSQEALQVAPLATQAKILTLFISAGHSDLAKFGDTVFTTGESMSSNIEATRQMLHQHFKNNLGLFIYNPEAVFSVNQKDNFESALKKKLNDNPQVRFSGMTGKQEIPEDDLRDVKSGKIKYIVFSTYPDESVKAIEQLVKNKIDLPLVSNSSWSTVDVEYIRRSIAELKSPIYMCSMWIPGSQESRKFEELFIKKYGIKPSTNVASGFDAGVIAGTTLKRSGKDLSPQHVLSEFQKNPCFSGTSVGQICFNSKGGFSDNKPKYYRLIKSGLRPDEK